MDWLVLALLNTSATARVNIVWFGFSIAYTSATASVMGPPGGGSVGR